MATSLRATGAQSRGALYDYLGAVKGINYYATWGSWDSFWLEYDHAKVALDMATLAAWGFNVVRFIVRTQTFGYPTPDPAYLALLADAVATAHAAGLRSQLTLFDGAPSGLYTDISGSQTWLAAVVDPYAADQRIAFIELQNELDTTNTAALAWSKTMLPYLRTHAGGRPITISVHVTAYLQTMVSAYGQGAGAPDFYSFHLYPTNQPAIAYKLLQTAIGFVSPKPLLVGECGNSTWSGLNYWPTPFGGTPNPATNAYYEAWQDLTYRTICYAARALGLPPPMPWLPFDLDPAHMQGGPSTKPEEWAFGLQRTDGTAKPALAIVQAYLQQSSVSLENDFALDHTLDDGRGGQWPAYWWLYSPDLGNPFFDPAVSHSPQGGSLAMQDTIISSRADCTWSTDTIFPLFPGTRYTLGAWVKGSAATGVSDLAINWFDDHYTFLGNSIAAVAPGGDFDWTHIAVTVAPLAGTVRGDIAVRSRGNTGTVWFDDISLHKAA